MIDKVEVEEPECIGCEQCVTECDEVFEMNEDKGVAAVKQGADLKKNEQGVKSAQESCPTSAIHVTERSESEDDVVGMVLEAAGMMIDHVGDIAACSGSAVNAAAELTGSVASAAVEAAGSAAEVIGAVAEVAGDVLSSLGDLAP